MVLKESKRKQRRNHFKKLSKISILDNLLFLKKYNELSIMEKSKFLDYLIYNEYDLNIISTINRILKQKKNYEKIINA